MKAIAAFESLLTTHGRLNRQNYIIVMAALAIPSGILSGIFDALPLEEAHLSNKLGGWHWCIIAIWLGLHAIAFFQIVRRWHDLGKPGAYWWLCQIPLANIVFGCILLFAKGGRGPNKYGPDPLGEIGDQDEAKLRAHALSEVESNEREPSTWAQALQESLGNQDQSKARYITLRVSQLSKERYRDQILSSMSEIDAQIESLKSEIKTIYNEFDRDQKRGQVRSLTRKKKAFGKYLDD